jgi:integrase
LKYPYQRHLNRLLQLRDSEHSDLLLRRHVLGHSSVSVTQRVYAHLLQNTLRSASEVVGKTLETAWESVARAGDIQK